MSVTRPSPSLPSPSRTNPNIKFSHSSSSSSRLRKPPDLPSLIHHRKSHIRCDFTSFDSPQRWTVDCVSGSDPIHIILKPPPSSIPMVSTAELKNSKKVCLFYCAEMKALAERIAAESDAIELRSITWRYLFL